MELEYVDKLPEIARDYNRSPKHNILKYINEFLESGRDLAQVRLGPGDFAENHTCATSFINSINYYKVAGVKVVIRNHQTYLVRE